MPQFIPIDNDPFAAQAAGPTLVPVDHDPFASASQPVQSPDGKGFFDRLDQDYSHRQAGMQDIAMQAAEGTKPLWQAYPEMAVKNAGIVGDALVTEPAKSLLSGIQLADPTDTQQIKDVAGAGIGAAAHIMGQLPSFGGGTIGQRIPQELAQPNIKDAVNMGGDILNTLGVLPEAKTLSPAINSAAKAGVSAAENAISAPIAGAKNIASGITARSPDEMNLAAQAMRSASSNLYKQSASAGAVLTPTSGFKLASDLDKIVPNADTSASKTLYKQTLSAINGLKDDMAKGDVSLETLDRHRQILGNIAKDITNPNRAQEANMASEAIDAIDNHVKGMTAADIQSKDTSAIDSLLSARAQWSKAKKFEMVSDVIQQANGDQAKLKSGFSRLYNNDKKMMGLTGSEKEAIRIAGTNNMSEKIMKGLGRFGLAPENVYLPAVSEGLGAMAGHTVGGTALIGTGTAARQANKLLARGKAENVLKTIERRK